jgi:diguanylate cyclase (GGDEF)-like protein/PAS domain S-box-containing protein
VHPVLADRQRIAALNSTGLLDRPSSETLDSLTRLACRCLSAPAALVSLVDAERQFFAASNGLSDAMRTKRELPLTGSLCERVVTSGEVVSVHDARIELNDDTRTIGNSLIAYLGAPLINADGFVLGTFCVMDSRPREWTDADRETVIDLARASMVELHGRTVSAALASTNIEYEELLNITTELVCAVDPEGVMTYVNKAWCDTFGYAREQVIGARSVEFVAPEHRARFIDVARRLQQGEQVDEFEVVAIGHEGRRIICRGNGRATMETDAHGVKHCRGMRAVYRNITRERMEESALRESEERYRTLVDMSPDGIVKHSAGIIRYANAAMASLVGVDSPDALVGTPVVSLSHPEDRARIADRVRRLVDEGTLAPIIEERIMRADGSFVHCEVSGAPIMVEGQPGVLAMVRDVSLRKRTEAALRESEAAFRGLLETVRAIAITLDVDGKVTFANDALLELTGWTRERVIGADWFDRFVPQADIMRRLFLTMVQGEDSVAHYESEIVTRQGRRRLIVWDHTLLRDPSGAIVGTASIGQDVTEQRAAEARLAALSQHDELTGLLNRRGIVQQIEYGLRAAARASRHDTLLYLDLDRFKPINDTYGHAEGDAVLREIAEIIRDTIRTTDFAGRLGGDEFAIYAVDLGMSDAHVLVNRLQLAVQSNNAAARARGRTYDIAFSLGMAETRSADTRDSLLARADSALYLAKKSAR